MHTESQPALAHDASGLYVTVGIVSLILTAIAFLFVFNVASLRHFVVPVIVILAVVQVFLQVWLFMHLGTGRRLYQVIFGYGVVVALAVVFGSIEVLTSYVAPVAATTSTVLKGPQLLAYGAQEVSGTCEVCHALNGKGASGPGPNLNLVLTGKLNLVPGGQPTDTAWLVKWISDPQAVWSKAIMPDLGLTPSQVQGVIDYLKSQVK